MLCFGEDICIYDGAISSQKGGYSTLGLHYLSLDDLGLKESYFAGRK